MNSAWMIIKIKHFSPTCNCQENGKIRLVKASLFHLYQKSLSIYVVRYVADILMLEAALGLRTQRVCADPAATNVPSGPERP